MNRFDVTLDTDWLGSSLIKLSVVDDDNGVLIFVLSLIHSVILAQFCFFFAWLNRCVIAMKMLRFSNKSSFKTFDRVKLDNKIAVWNGIVQERSSDTSFNLSSGLK